MPSTLQTAGYSNNVIEMMKQCCDGGHYCTDGTGTLEW